MLGLEMEIKIAEIERKREEDARNLASGIFEGLTNPRGPGSGLRAFGLGQLHSLEGQMFTNLLTSSMTDANGQPTGPLQQITKSFGQIGDATSGGSNLLTSLFRGTIFDGDRGKDPVKQSVDKATASIDNLKDSVNALTSILGGTPPAGSGLFTGIPSATGLGGISGSTLGAVARALGGGFTGGAGGRAAWDRF